MGMIALCILAYAVLAAIFLTPLIIAARADARDARSGFRNSRNQSTRESEPTGFLGVGGAADQCAFHNSEIDRG